MFKFLSTTAKVFPSQFQKSNMAFMKPKTLFNISRAYFVKYRKPTTPWFKNAGFEKKRKYETLYEAGLWMFTFGLCYSALPFYTILCQHFGFDTDLKQKDYSVMHTNDKKLFLHRKFKVKFQSDVDPDLNWDFDPIQDELIVNAGETALVFYKVTSKETKPIIGFASYEISPAYASLYFSKIQCFCFHQQLLNPFEELQLPLYFYLEPEILDDQYLANNTNDEITVIYKFIRAKKQDLAKLADQELRRVNRNKKILKDMRKNKQIKEKGDLNVSEIDADDDESTISYGQGSVTLDQVAR